MNLKWRESVEYFSSYASLKCCVGEIRKRDREINKQYEPRMLMPFRINLKNVNVKGETHHRYHLLAGLKTCG